MKHKTYHTLVIASHNTGKIAEIRALFRDFFADIKSASDLGLPEPEENGTTFRENALIKARAARAATGFISIADDSGLVIPALNGEPGIYSARWAGSSKDFSIIIDKIEKKLKEKNITDFSANMVCALAISFPNGDEKIFEGEIAGTLIFPKRGTNGSGFDPIFIADGMTETYGEIAAELKNAINPRAVAFQNCSAFLKRIIR
ncbi:MAG TPA: non-canonical purine NTP pyrophosphatase [Gammaproteobacteria bacterium]|nr:non-canonical purine NTP pyrophosphatase [Gammaproteobacteria bacterium]